MVDDPQELILEHLRAIRGDIKLLQDGQGELKAGQLAIREEVHGLRGDVLRLERGLATVETDVDRIKNRLDLVDQV